MATSSNGGRSRSRRLPGEGTIGTRIRTRKDGSEYLQYYAALGSGRSRVWVYGKSAAEVTRRLNDLRKRRDEGILALKNIPTLDAWLEAWLEHHVKRSTNYATYIIYGHLVHTHLMPALGTRRLDRLTTPEIQAFLNDGADSGLAPRTVRHLRATLRTALNAAIGARIISHNAAKFTAPARLRQRERKRLTPEQARTLLTAARSHHLGVLFILALATGTRQGQLLGLGRSGIDFDGGVLRFTNALHRRNRAYVLDAPKSEDSRRVLPLPPPLADLLREHLGRQMLEREGADLVFATPLGYPLSGRVVTVAF